MQADFVINPYDTPASPLDGPSAEADLPSLMLRGPWSEEISRYIADHQIRGLYLNYTKGWARSDYAFLREVAGLRLLDIIDLPIADLSPVADLTELQVFSLSAETKGTVEFNQLKKLRRCALTWWRGAKGLFTCPALEDLDLRGIAESELGSISELPTLKKLTLQSNLRSLEHLRGLNKLEKLVLLDCKNLNDLSALTEFPRLRWLAIDGSKKIADFSPLAGLKSLEVLDLSNCGKIPSLAPLASLQKLKALAFAGSTTSIEDGDLSLLTSLPELSMLMFAPRKHYTHRLLKTWNWNDFHHPENLLEAKAH